MQGDVGSETVIPELTEEVPTFLFEADVSADGLDINASTMGTLLWMECLDAYLFNFITEGARMDVFIDVGIRMLLDRLLVFLGVGRHPEQCI